MALYSIKICLYYAIILLSSVASDLKKQGYSTFGTHPYVGYGWNRRNAYPLLGFDTAKFAVDMPGLQKIRVYTDDASYYDYLMRKMRHIKI